ncbi:WD40 repeat domain-containing protein [Chloroflexia bacterium SDU3-3]|nr:WD40 repeat domain-containing protein [Chloroflexia bacterium SDU3-3]
MRSKLPMIYAAGVMLLAACGPAVPAPPATSPPPPPAQPSAPSTATPAPAPTQAGTARSPTPQAIATPTLEEATATTLSALIVGTPQSTPELSHTTITEQNIQSLRMLRTVGIGQPISAAISPDNSLLAVLTAAGIALFDIESRSLLRFDDLGDATTDIAFDKGGEHIYLTQTKEGQQQVMIWSLRDGSVQPTARMATLPAPQGTRAYASPSGAFEATLMPLDSAPVPGVTITRTSDGRVVYADQDSDRIAFSPDSTLAALITYSTAIHIVDLNDGSVDEIAVPWFMSAAFSPDGQTLAASGHALWLWGVIDGQLTDAPAGLDRASFSGMIGATQQLRYSPDGGTLTVDGRYTLFEAVAFEASAWSIRDGKASHAWDSSAGGPGVSNYSTYVGAISPATRVIAWTDDGVTLNIRDGDRGPYAPPGPSAISSTLQLDHPISALLFSDDGQRLAVADRAGGLRVVRASDGTLLHQAQAQSPVIRMVFSPDGAMLGGLGEDHTIMTWDVDDLEPRMRFADGWLLEVGNIPPGVPSPTQFSFSYDRQLLIVWQNHGVRFYRLSDGTLLHHIPTPADQVFIGPLGKLVGVVTGGQVQLWGIP